MSSNRRDGGNVLTRSVTSPHTSSSSSCTAAAPTNNDRGARQRISQRRRTISTGKLSQIFHGSLSNERASTTALNAGLQDLAMTSKLVTKIAETQRRGAEAILQWAHNAQNAAIDDVMQHTNQLFQMFADKQIQFANEYDHFLKQLQKICDADQVVVDAERDVRLLDEKERKLKKDIGRGVSFFRQRRGGDVCLLRQQLEEVSTAKEAAQRTLSETRAEMEVVKMFRFRHGMQGIADSYRTLAHNCEAIFSCHREITEMVPAISNQDVRRMVYDGMPVTRDRVEDLRRSLDSGLTTHQLIQPPPSRRRSEPIRNRVQSSRHGTPPPPYSPTAPPEDIMPSQPIQRVHSSDSQLMYHQATTNPLNITTISQPPTIVPTSSSHAQQNCASNCRMEWHRRSIPCSGCGRLYPDLPPNPYVTIKHHSSHGGYNATRDIRNNV